MKAVYALYPTRTAAERAVDSLHAGASELGIKPRDVAVLTSEPFDESEFERPRTRTLMPLIAALGGLLGGGFGYCLTSFTQKAYPLPTGSMPIAPLWTNGIITYELMMLGAIAGSLVTLLVSAPLPNWGRKLYDPGIADGKILVGVINPPDDSRAEVERRLRDSGADEVKEFKSGRPQVPRETPPSKKISTPREEP